MIEGWLKADWPAPAGVRAGTTTRRWPGVSRPPFDRGNFGARCGDDPEAVAHNRAMLLPALGLPCEPRWLRQVHGTGVVVVTPAGTQLCATATSDPAAINDVAVAHRCAPADSGHHRDEPEADAAVTRDPGVVLAILTADCLPVVFASDDGAVIGAAHAGWRGLAAGVLEATIDATQVDAARLIAWFGPAAGPAAYEVGAEVRAAFVDLDPASASAFAPTRAGHWHCDLYALARRRLALGGVTRVSGGTRCTITDHQQFHSHRRDGRAGRMVTLVWSTGASGESPRAP